MQRRASIGPKFIGVVLAMLLVVPSVFLPGTAYAATVVTFTTPGTTSWTVPAGVTSVNVLVVAGGGGGGGAGGGGGGGVVYATNYAVTPLAGVTVTVGAGATAITNATGGATPAGNNGANSVFGTITAVGGGGGGGYAEGAGVSGGSGGGGTSNYSTNAGGAATQGNSGGGIGYGHAGGTGSNSNAPYTSGGGGGAGGAGSSANGAASGSGGQGYLSKISGTATYYGGGGGGGEQQAGTAGNGGAGGGGGGAGCGASPVAGTGGSNGGGNGTTSGGAGGYGIGGSGGTNSGGGGGGMCISIGTAGAGGSGIVIVSYGAPTITLTQNVTATGNVSVLGTLSKGSGTFVIDDPVDPKNELLYHSFVESPDVMDMYDGIAQLDGSGSATVVLPDYFLALNDDFRYLATPIGSPMPNLYLSSGVKPEFLGLFGAPVLHVHGGAPNGEISWQITGIRHDPYILAHPIIPVVEKGPGQLVGQGQYLFPQFYAKQ